MKFELIRREDPRWLAGRLRSAEAAYEHLIDGHAHSPSEALEVTVRGLLRFAAPNEDGTP